jgi:hypothetical protein
VEFDQAIADKVCRHIAEGESLREICEAADMPSRETIRLWLKEHEDFVGQYARAREEQADHYADEIIEIADMATDAQLARLRVDARKWKASKLAPKRYGERQVLAGDPDAPLVGSITVNFQKGDASQPA